MASKLFFICPDCNSENFVRSMYGEDAYFISCLGASFPFHDRDYMRSIGFFIKRESIDEIYITHSVHCRFIKPSSHANALAAGENSFYRPLLPSFFTKKQREKYAESKIHLQIENFCMHGASLNSAPHAKITINGLVLDHNAGRVIRSETFAGSFLGYQTCDLN